MVSVHRDYQVGDKTTSDWVKRLAELQTEFVNPLQTTRWHEFATLEEESEGFILTSVCGRPRTASNSYHPYLFVKDADGNQYFVHKNDFGSIKREWYDIKHGDNILILPQQPLRIDGKATKVQVARIFDQRTVNVDWAEA